MREFTAQQIGVMASKALQLDGAGKVMGVTSSGAFLRIKDAIIFLTRLPYRSPYNLQLSQADLLLPQFQHGEPFQVVDQCITFTMRGIAVNTRNTEVWKPGQPVLCRTTPTEQMQLVDQLFSQIRVLEGDKGFLYLIDPPTGPVENQNQSILNASQTLLEAFQNQELTGILTASEVLLGAGGGLTPSGDDFLAGFFLYHLRSSQSLARHAEFTSKALEQIIELARRKTTTISVNRLQAALQGWSEELFLVYLDYIFAPDSISLPENLPQALLNFGHSSGVDTLVGIYFAVSSMAKN